MRVSVRECLRVGNPKYGISFVQTVSKGSVPRRDGLGAAEWGLVPEGPVIRGFPTQHRRLSRRNKKPELGQSGCSPPLGLRSETTPRSQGSVGPPGGATVARALQRGAGVGPRGRRTAGLERVRAPGFQSPGDLFAPSQAPRGPAAQTPNRSAGAAPRLVDRRLLFGACDRVRAADHGGWGVS